MAIGHEPSHSLSAKDAELFRAFQSNLLSLISHELKTPLMGVLNALTLLKEDFQSAGSSPIPRDELVDMAKDNADKLNRALSSLLDLAALESGLFHARLRELDFSRLVHNRVDANRSLLKTRKLTIEVREESAEKDLAPVLADPNRLGRAVDLCFSALLPRTEEGTAVKVRIFPSEVSFQFYLQTGAEKAWEQSWSQSLAGFQGGVSSPSSAFAGTIQSEQAFLTRTEEGLGSEFLLIHEFMKLHQGGFKCKTLGRDVTLSLILPKFTNYEALKAVILARSSQMAPENGGLGSIAVGLLKVPDSSTAEVFRSEIRKFLFRSSDAVYALPEQGQVAVVLDDCKPQDVPELLQRLGTSMQKKFKFGVAVCPVDSSEPDQLIKIAQGRMNGVA
ncbi:hypothetical protein K2X30_09915 [bacterium]|jgi:hypothetical protein|nr:hypothetical protein [bacterium]